MLDKEKLELLNLRQRVSKQREEIKKLSEQLERHKAYTKELEDMISRTLLSNDKLKESYMMLKINA